MAKKAKAKKTRKTTKRATKKTTSKAKTESTQQGEKTMAQKTQGPTVYNAMIMILSSASAPPRPTPPPGGGTPPPSGGEHPDNTLPGDLPHPEHPIFLPLPPGAPVDPGYFPPGIGGPGSGGPVDPGWSGGTAPPGEEGGAPRPTHPIVLPPDSGGGWLPVYIDNTLPGTDPGWSGGVAPPGEEGGAPRPTHPIVIPPDMPIPPDLGIEGTIKFKAIWTPSNGWQTIGVVIPGGEHVTPSKSKSAKK
jgi:hypothetical protein